MMNKPPPTPWRIQPLSSPPPSPQPGENAHKKRSKRSFSDTMLSPNSGNECVPVETATYARFFVVEATDKTKPIGKLSPFVVEKVIQGSIGSVESCKKLDNGSLLLQVDSTAKAEKLLKMTKFFDREVIVTAHRSLNTCKGVIRSHELAELDKYELLEGLRSSGVVDAYNITKFSEGQRVKTATIILTFLGTKLPEEIKVCFLLLKVSPYIPSPLRCFKCQKYGHSQAKCRREAVCGKCGEKGHDSRNCTKESKCINCAENHPSYSRSCPKFLEEKAICKVKVMQRVSFPEAKRLHHLANPTVSYAAITARSAAVSTQRAKVGQAAGTQTLSKCKCLVEDIECEGDKIIVPSKYKTAASVAVTDESIQVSPMTHDISKDTNEGLSRPASPSPQRTKQAGPSQGRGDRRNGAHKGAPPTKVPPRTKALPVTKLPPLPGANDSAAQADQIIYHSISDLVHRSKNQAAANANINMFACLAESTDATGAEGLRPRSASSAPRKKINFP